jgi:ELWxxDGT repeat protein
MKHLFSIGFLFISCCMYAQVPILLKDIVPGTGSSTEFSDQSAFSLDSLYFFTAAEQDPPGSQQYWVTDGSEAGTHILKSIVPNIGGGTYASYLFSFKGIAYFVATDDVNGGESMWRTNGLTDSTYKFIEDCGLVCSFRGNAIVLGNKLLFTGTDGNGEELWTTDGTIGGTSMLKDIQPGPNSGAPKFYKAANGWVYFAADNNGTNQELWRTDGTEAGTQLFLDLNNSPLSSSIPIPLATVGNNLFFSAVSSTSSGNSELWKTDGTAQGTKLVKGYGPNEGTNIGVYFTETAVLGDKLLFTAFDSLNGRNWWITNGEPNDAHIVKKITNSFGYYTGNRILFSTDSFAIFGANDLVHGWELWRTDGTSDGTYMIKDIYPGIPNGITQYNVVTARYKNRMFFPGLDVAHGMEIWETDGTESGTKRLTDMAYNFSGIYADKQNFVVIGNHLYFTGATNEYGFEVWKLLIDAPVSTEDLPRRTNLNVEIYPNPNQGIFHITGNLERPTPLDAVLTDLQGRMLYTQHFDQLEGSFLRRFEVAGLPTGLYMLTVQTNKGVRTLPVSIVSNL